MVTTRDPSASKSFADGRRHAIIVPSGKAAVLAGAKFSNIT